jgi:hypothetical protein
MVAASTGMAGPEIPAARGWSCNTTYAVMTLVMLAIGTGLSLPTAPRLPTPSIVRAAEPVVGHGNEGEVPGSCTELASVAWNSGAGTARDH